MSAQRTRGLIGATLVVAVLGVAAACGTEDASSPPAAQPTQTVTMPSPTPSASPSGTPSTDCPETITAVRAATDKAVWGQGAATSKFNPVSVTICQYDAQATGQDYATITTKRMGKQATDLFALVNAAKPVAKKPSMCTKELGPTYVLRFTDNDRGVLSFTAEAFGCRRLVATSLEGQGKPGALPAPRQVTAELTKSLGLR
ncbi:hypothetical protein EV651_102314 [Kribbella sp. VKM Ac-2571]|uniref:hypothetical protein n=1 Tax=Kribbella sp. VKM Ac-2571 TaxID=2512222 RepID=UPI0010CEB84A|nr:hypothetical protein [Kribbella sp. VKM Ac-2571]TDO68394.1 hypothetical protein EV651_102314 [Kribbella sp. VKM Ac-2571]